MFRIALSALFLSTALSTATSAGGYCGEGCLGPTEESRAAPVGRLAPVPQVAEPVLSEARLAYDRALTDLWRSEANGTCLGTLGAWHLTPYHVMAEGTVYEIASITGTASRIGVVARRIHDEAEAHFTFVPRARNRVDVSGGVVGTTIRYIAALRRC